MKYYFFTVCCMLSLQAMDELPPEPTAQELHGQAVSSGITAMAPTFFCSLPVIAASQIILTLPASSVTCAATVATLGGVYSYCTERYPTPVRTKWKQLVILRPQIVSTINDTQRELSLRDTTVTETLLRAYGFTHYQVGVDKLQSFAALCKKFADDKVPASRVALYLAKRKRKLEDYKDAMIKLAPYSFATNASTDRDLSSPMPSMSIFDKLSFGDPESPEQVVITQMAMNSCVKVIGKLEEILIDINTAMGT